MTMQETIGNNYGVSMTSESFVAMIGNDIKPTSNNLTMRQQISARGFSRVSRKFADEVIELINKKKTNKHIEVIHEFRY